MSLHGRLVEEGDQRWIDTAMSTLAGQSRFRVVAKEGRFLAIKVPGFKYWGGLGMPQDYAPAAFRVMHCEDDDPDRVGSQWAERLEIPIRS